MPSTSDVLGRIQEKFPDVTKIKDAKSKIQFEVLPTDIKKGTRYQPTECALAKACQRQIQIDGVMINLASSYLIDGETAFRFRTPESVRRELIAFDRYGDMAPGVYYLRPHPKSNQMGAEHFRPSGQRGNPKKKKKTMHLTERVRRIVG